MTVTGAPVATLILCTDCHNSDDNREFGGNGPNGPHGSMFAHIMERRYEFSQAPAPGMLITNLFPNPSLSVEGGASGGPYALCAKCHDLAQILNNTSFSEHARHIKRRILVLGMPYGPRHGRTLGHHFRRTLGEF